MTEGGGLTKICGKTETELQELSPEERKDYLRELGVGESGLLRVIRESYKLLGLVTFFTYTRKSYAPGRSPKATKAPQAAGKIHTDFERGFIRAEVIHYKDSSTAAASTTQKPKG